MSNLKQITLTITLLPLIFLLIVSGINLEKKSKLRILIWTTPEISIGTSIAITSSLSFIVGILPYLLLIDPKIKKRRKVKLTQKDIYSSQVYESDDIEEKTDLHNVNENEINYIERDVRDPLPTISVSYRVLNQPSKQNAKDVSSSSSLYEEESKLKSAQPCNYSDSTNSSDNDWNNELDNNW
ncbi:hypothetical protein [Prochlorococcus sp. MIT 0601]|uniref:hypothetical protein n=1 Tax=Prochlorococcus sp. MIT 0601 TaxID=1499498 RepID=UPI000533A5DA|nr:hypothetical protein [Prochlorococcus sp. MIT 0601]KGG12445.1 putative Uncharacterized secreted protein [Prochlorococcus sp. MIT 0601]